MFGEFIKNNRLNKGLTLREFCKLIEVDASNWSKVERGLLAPPQEDKKLKRIAEVLGIKPKSTLWQEMKDKANIQMGSIPKDILSNSKVLNALPMFFRTLRNEKPTAEDLDKLNDIIREKE
jgi:transcriptional regulator with XRE-family HTH domain